MREREIKALRLILVLALLLLVIAGAGLYGSGRYIEDQLLRSNEAMATDIALLTANNFHVTDEEVRYMKALTFNEMEVDPINQRLMDVGNGVSLNAAVTNVYVVAPLEAGEVRFCPNQQTADFLGYAMDTPLDGIWLFNGKINEKGVFEPAQRDDIYRYTALDETQRRALQLCEPVGAFTSDAWGNFITGYAPLYTEEGSFVGLLGIDMDPDQFQNSAQRMILLLIGLFAATVLLLVCSFLFFYNRYTKAKEGQLQFKFYSRMSHDLRTPMNGILGLSALSRDETDADTLRRNFSMVEDAGAYMLGLINDALDYQQIEAGGFSLNPQIHTCREIYTSLMDMIAPSARRKHIDLQVDTGQIDLDACVLVDDVRLKQIVMNLLTNAIQFTPENGTVRLTMTRQIEREGNAEFRFTIADTGVGIGADFMKSRLFKPFEQENRDLTLQNAGTGLGLAITKRLVERMNGQITVQSEPGRGAAFTVTLRIPTVDPETARAAGAEQHTELQRAAEALAGKRFLLCEDHPINVLVTRKLVEKAGGIIDVAADGKQGLEAFQAAPINHYDAILMDIHMPVMDGLEAARRIRALNRLDAAAVPIVAVTANAYDEDVRNTREAGMNAHLTKPIDPKTFYQTLSDVLTATTPKFWVGRTLS